MDDDGRIWVVHRTTVDVLGGIEEIMHEKPALSYEDLRNRELG
jgi:hypothetical protein